MDILKGLFEFARPYRRYFYLAGVFMFANIGLGMINPYLQKLLVNKVLLEKQKGLLVYLLMGMLAVSIVTSAFGYLYSYLVEYTSQRTIADIRHKMFNHLQEVSFSFYDKARTGELMSRLTGDLEGVRVFLPGGFLQFFNSTTTFVAYLVMLFTINWKLTLLTLILSPFLVTLSMRFDKKIRSAFDELRKQYAVLNTTLQENITGIKVVKAFAQEPMEIQKFKRENINNMNRGIDIGFISGRYSPVMWFIGDMSFVMLIWFGGYLVVKGQLSLGSLIQFNGYLWSMIWPLRALPNILNMYEQANASGERIFNLLNTRPQIKNPEHPVIPHKITGNIVFENVSLKYDEEMVLKNVNIDIPAGKKVAIMGATGSGKTSIVNLIGRYYDVTKGRVLVDGYDVRDLDLKALRRSIGIVMQETFLFSDTIKNNIAFGKPDATMDEIIAAAKAAQAHDFIMEMPEGYDTVVGERGVGLSGGQKQRIAIARAILKNPPILILDDATASVDMETEAEIQRNLSELAKGRTTIIIAHRISSVKDADEIIVLENGSIVERGTHKELMKLKGRYYRNFKEQFKAMFTDEMIEKMVKEVIA
ncbi:ABC transporter ATP-binding protein [Caldanaerobius polysaccharolyticus]|uniref:ABC transporter ATP-binding protein n=1 Tax=Caldanaerobius polysaccharolyticus TaxID=44256 RepID=UPI0004795BE4|nr:ABC transporter ATP-binding protein [Caldanaerobius polysaccharolyticus]